MRLLSQIFAVLTISRDEKTNTDLLDIITSAPTLESDVKIPVSVRY